MALLQALRVDRPASRPERESIGRARATYTVTARRAVVGITLALLVAACGGGQTVTGSFTLTDSDVRYSATSCSGTGGFSDVQEGLRVTVRDEAGKTIGSGSLIYDPAGSSASRCRFTFTVPLTDIASFYEIEVGRRGKLTYSLSEMESRGWSVALTLGG